MIVDSVIFENTVERDMIGLIKSLNKKEMDDIISSLDFSNKSIVVLRNK